MSGQLPAPIVNGGGNSFWKWTDFQLSRPHDLDLGSDGWYCIGLPSWHGRASLIDLYLHATLCHWNRRNFICGRTDVQLNDLRPILLGRLRRVDLNIWINGRPQAFDKGELAPLWRLENWEAAAVDCCPGSNYRRLVDFNTGHIGSLT